MSLPDNPLPDGELIPPPLPPALPETPINRVLTPPWSIVEVIFLAAVTLIATFLFQFAAVGVALHYHPKARLEDLAKNAKVIVPSQFIAYLVVLLVMAMLLRSRGLHFWRNVNWTWPRFLAAFLFGGFVLAIAIQLLGVFLPIPKQLPIDDFFADTAGTYLLALFGVTMAPLVEELLFRGFMYPAFARYIGVGGSVIVTSILFTAIHAPQLARAWAPMVLLFVVALTLTITRVRTGSVAASFLVHVGYNFTLFAFLFFSTDHFRHLEKMR